MKRLAILAALAVAVGAALWLDHRRPTTVEKKRQTEELAPELDTGAIDRITVERGATKQVLLRKNGAWWLEDGTRADDSAAEAILATLRYGRVERQVDPSLAVKLDRAHVVAGPVELSIGEDAAGRGVYVRRGADLLVAETHLYEVVTAELRSRSAVVDDVNAANTVQVGPLALERHGGWRIVAPGPALADEPRVQELLQALASARADSFAAGSAPSPAPDDAVISLDGKLQSRLRQNGCGKLSQVARADGAVLCFSAATLAPLQVRVDDLRLPRLTAMALDAIDAVDLDVAGKQLSLRRVDHEWRITAPVSEAGPADDSLVRERLKALLELKARAFGPPGPSPLGTLHLGGAGEEVRLTLAKSGYEIRAQRQAEDSALILPASALKLLDPDPLSVRSRRPDTFRPDSVTMVSGDGAELPRRSPLVEALADLHAQTVQRRSFETRHTLRITAAGKPHTFLLGPRDADGCLLRTSESGPAFVVAPPTCAVLYAPFEKTH